MINELGFNKTWFDVNMNLSIVSTYVSQTTKRFSSKVDKSVIKEEVKEESKAPL